MNNLGSSGLRNILEDNPNHGTSITVEQRRQNPRLNDILFNKVRFESYTSMMSDLNVALEHYSADLPPEKRDEMKDVFSTVENSVKWEVSFNRGIYDLLDALSSGA